MGLTEDRRSSWPAHWPRSWLIPSLCPRWRSRWHESWRCQCRLWAEVDAALHDGELKTLPPMFVRLTLWKLLVRDRSFKINNDRGLDNVRKIWIWDAAHYSRMSHETRRCWLHQSRYNSSPTASALQANPNSALETKVFGLKSFLTIVLATSDVHHIGALFWRLWMLSCN